MWARLLSPSTKVTTEVSTVHIDEGTGARTPQLILPSGSGAAIAVDRTTAYVAAGDRVFVLSLPMQAP